MTELRRRRGWVVLVGLVLTAACLPAGFLRAQNPAEKDALEKNIDDWCFAWVVTPPDGVQERAILLEKARWRNNSTISVVFLDGEPELRAKVEKYAKTWALDGGGPANLTFSFSNAKPADADIRISFKQPGSWSAVGTSCRYWAKDKPTMNFGTINSKSSESHIRRKVLHEFGHAIGLVHEHQHPKGGIKWNYCNVIEELMAPPNSWKITEICRNLFEPFEAKETNSTKEMDSQSIMIYPIAANWTKDGYSTPYNDNLSPGDKAFVRTIYPKDAP